MLLGKCLITAKSVASSEQALAMLRDAGVEAVVRMAPSPSDENWLVEQVSDVDALVVTMEPASARVLDAAPRLRIIARPGVGTDTIDLETATRRGVLVTITAGTNDQSVADFTLALLLEATRRTSVAAASVNRGG